MTSAAVGELFLYCKQGDLAALRDVMEKRELDINIHDEWDSTPIYYACLCGHEDVVEFLLQKGAKCEASSFDGERCLYGALTNQIRMKLRNWKQINSIIMRRENYYEFMRSMLTCMAQHKDVSFNICGVKFAGHKSVLSARSQYFAKMFIDERWQNKSSMKFKNDNIASRAFEALLAYIYCGSVDIELEYLDDFKMLAKQFNVLEMSHEIEVAEEKIQKFLQLKPNWSSRVKLLSIDSLSATNQLRKDMWRLVQLLLPLEHRDWIEGVLPFPPNHQILLSFTDLCFLVEGKQFMCHKAFMCTKSSYFEALLANHFNENSSLSLSNGSSNIPVITLHNVSLEIFKIILVYIYSDTFETKSFETAYEVLLTCDMMLLPDLKRRCGTLMAEYIDEFNVCDIIQCSKMFNLTRLEDQCTEFIAQNIEQIVENPDFISLVESEAYSVTNREEFDSIPIVDEIRYHITYKLASTGQIDEANGKLAMIDSLLSRLGIDG